MNMDVNKSRSIKNLVYSALSQVITIAIGLILPRLYIVSYGSETNGLLNSVNQFIVYLSLFEAGIGAVSLQALYGPVAQSDTDKINGILSATNIHYKKAGYGYLTVLVAISLVYPVVVDSELDYWVIAGVILLSGISNVLLFLVQGKYKLLLQAEGKSYILSNLSTVISVLVGVAKALLVSFGYNVLHALSAAFIINLFQVVYIYLYIRKKYRWIDLSVKPNNDAISEKNYMLIHQISGMIFQNTDVLILTVLCDLKVVSVYSMYKLVITQIEHILSIITGSLNFLLGQSFNIDVEAYKGKIDLFESYYSAIAFALFTVAQALMVPFMGLYTQGVEDINYQDYTVAVLFVVIALLTVMRTPMLNTINYAGHFKKTTPQTILESVINMVVSITCVLQFGMYGVLFGTVVALVYRTNDIIIYTNKKILKRSPAKTYLVHVVNVAIYVVLSTACYSFVPDLHSYLDFILCGAVITLISLPCFIVGQSLIFPNRFKTAISIIFKK